MNRVNHEGQMSLCSVAKTIEFFPEKAMRAPKRAGKNFPTVPAKAVALEAAKNIAAATAEPLHARVEAR